MCWDAEKHKDSWTDRRKSKTKSRREETWSAENKAPGSSLTSVVAVVKEILHKQIEVFQVVVAAIVLQRILGTFLGLKDVLYVAAAVFFVTIVVVLN